MPAPTQILASADEYGDPASGSGCCELFHSYEPRQGHRLPHDPLNMIAAPRPIGWISTRSASGGLNLAPYSFFNAFNYKPPIIGFSSIGYKDSVRNVEQTREFAWNLVTSASLPPEASEFDFAGLTPLESQLISAPRVAESPVSRCTQIIQLAAADGHKVFNLADPRRSGYGPYRSVAAAERYL